MKLYCHMRMFYFPHCTKRPVAVHNKIPYLTSGNEPQHVINSSPVRLYLHLYCNIGCIIKISWNTLLFVDYCLYNIYTYFVHNKTTCGAAFFKSFICYKKTTWLSLLEHLGDLLWIISYLLVMNHDESMYFKYDAWHL